MSDDEDKLASEHDSGCGIAHALDLVGERWALLIVRELVLGSKRFTDLQAGLPSVGANVLSQRLRDLEAVGVIRRDKLPPPAGSWVYALTEWGAGLEPVLLGLSRWGSACPTLPPSGPVGSDSLMLGLRSSFDPTKARPGTTDFVVGVDDDRYAVRILDGSLYVTRGDLPNPHATIDMDRATLAELLANTLAITEAIKKGLVKATGDIEAVKSVFPAITTTP